ncbi:hypothetical protein SNE40_001526 [Patella caerulea]|uniref:CUB-like domain-containing protein n=1 Tax=Patella caerulea TaxID=87958 RepID=A0AAN8Q887_PATCE
MPNIEMNLCSIVLLALLPLATADLTVDVQPCALPMEPNTTTGSIVITNSTAEVNETCTITIPNIEKSEQISLYLHQLKSPSPNLFYVYDGVYNSMLNDTNTKLLYNSTGKTGPVWMVIFSNVSTIVFNRTDNDVENITIDFDSEKCVQTVSSGEISPPHFLPDTADLSCSYDLNQTLESSYVGVLSFLTFDISDGSIMMDNSTRYSGSTLPKDTFLTKPDVNVDLSLKKSNKSQTFSGLLSQVVKDCSEIINVNITQDYTIQIPSQHYLVTECRLIFTSHNAKQLKVELHTVKLHGADHLNLADGDSQGDRDMVGGDYSLADTSTGNIFLTSGSSVWVRLVIDTLPGKREVKLRVSESDGDGRYYDQGKLTLGASKKQAGTFDYYYQLVTSTQVEVSLNQTSLKSDGSIEFYDGLQTTSKLITSFGADSTFYPVTSSKGELLIVARNFTTEQIPATFQNVIGSCNVDTSERTGSYSLLKLTQDEKKCMWTISPQTGGEVIALQLLKINLRNNDTLTVSSIGTATTSQILSKFTGPMLTSFIPQINIPSDHRTQ